MKTKSIEWKKICCQLQDKSQPMTNPDNSYICDSKNLNNVNNSVI